jgi:hypothetical protein
MGVSMIKFVLAILLSLRVMSLHAMPEDTTNTQQDQPPGLITFPQFSIIGKWNYQIPNSTCVETYEFSSDGNLRASSAEQVTDSIYFISDQHSEFAFYKLEHQVMRANGEKDCDGEVSRSGTSAVHYVRFDETGNSLVMCQDESAYLEQCFGPLYRSEL